MTEVTRERPRTSRAGVWALLGVGVVAAVMYFPVLQSLVGQWWDDSNYRHGFLVPVISGLLVYRRWDELNAARPGGGVVLGSLFIAASAAFLILGTAASELMTSRVSLPTFLIGLSLVFMGKEFTRIAAFPLVFLYLMVPLPYIIYYKIAFPLQLFSAKTSGTLLDLLGVNVIRQGNILHLPEYSLEVVAACSGLRSLMTMLTLALVIGAFGDLSNGKRWILALWAVPAAVAANTLRLLVTGLGAYVVSPAFADGFLHETSGIVVFATGFAVLLIGYLILRQVR